MLNVQRSKLSQHSKLTLEVRFQLSKLTWEVEIQLWKLTWSTFESYIPTFQVNFLLWITTLLSEPLTLKVNLPTFKVNF